MNHTSPPLPNLHSLSISPPPGSYPAPIQTNNNQYRYNGVFGPPSQGSTISPDWATSPKRASRSGIPQGWYDPNAPPSRESPNLNAFEAFRRDAPSPPALSPPSSITSVPTTASSHPYQSYQQPNYPPVDNFVPMAVTPSPPPIMSYQLNSAASAPNLAGYNPAGGLPQFGSQSLAGLSNNNRSQANGWRNGYGMPSIPASDDDVIPTAIVIKNIPFAVTRETLLGVMESLGAPLPYAFNYHHDNGVFRGLAFANFRAPDEAASVVAALNGYDVQGRKLRVEYKKVLQPGEKDKIEREKALKRMRSIQFDKSEMMPPPITLPNANSRPVSGVNMNGGGGGGGYDNNSPPQSATSTNSDSLPVTLDLNDPAVLDIYSRVLVFKEDRMRDELAFSKNLTATERRIVHLVAQKLGLSSSTRGEGEAKSVVVLREAPSRPTLTTSSSATVSSSSYLSPYSTTPTDLSPNLRIKKSMPDLRGFNGPVVARDPARSLNPQRSSGNLRADAGGRDYVSMGASAGRRAFGGGNGSGINGFNSGSGSFNNLFGSSIGDVPPVPPLPSGLGLHSKGHSISSFSNPTTGAAIGGADPMGEMLSSQPLRNPRGPAGESRGFGGTLRPSASRTGGIMGRRVSEEDEEVENSSIGGRSGSGSIGSNSAVGSERHAAMNQNQANGHPNGHSQAQQPQGYMEGMRTRESLEL
ncbi:uncharacterized protein I303_100709 [Kwoniella dejecticola CBS 10117]|uniref:Uncharacterized protein n=1 Tax=Kwoniella dejecticola CBS 10117 TaxID=1296121 RepID=A0A1A6AFR7_9TREE|nr:uncharacterized protein I303_00712 [Kwoniella dejecticola CBS 10117]OBR88894.1 hypothetical protein I303_00712 [Kwoniella dejecticola CBS 10117]